MAGSFLESVKRDLAARRAMAYRHNPHRSINSSVGRVKNVTLCIAEDELALICTALASRQYGPLVERLRQLVENRYRKKTPHREPGPVHRVVRLPGAALLTAVAMLVLRPVSLRPQVRAEYDVGALGLLQSLLRLQTTASVLHTGAHPDDEDSALIARLARGDHARVAYLSLNRGEGGQNTIGPELFEPLGVIRTEELLQARRLDGGQQLFTRAFDFGFSKTRAETAAFWGEEPILDDMVRAIRTVPPARRDLPFQRHAGRWARPSSGRRLSDADCRGARGRPLRVSRSALRRTAAMAGAEAVCGRRLPRGRRSRRPRCASTPGSFDPLLGRSYFEIAMEGRSQHRSQHQGALELRGERTSGSPAGRHHRERGADGWPVRRHRHIDCRHRAVVRRASRNARRGARRRFRRRPIGRSPHSTRSRRPTRYRSDRRPHGACAPRRSRSAGLALDPAAKAELAFRLTMKVGDFEDAIVRAAGLVVDPRRRRARPSRPAER